MLKGLGFLPKNDKKKDEEIEQLSMLVQNQACMLRM